MSKDTTPIEPVNKGRVHGRGLGKDRGGSQGQDDQAGRHCQAWTPHPEEDATTSDYEHRQVPQPQPHAHARSGPPSGHHGSDPEDQKADKDANE